VRCACIDIGSNTTRLLVADRVAGGLTVCAQDRAFTLIGRSLDASQTIPRAKLEEVCHTVVRQHSFALELGAEHVRCVATAAIRRAVNGSELGRMLASVSPELVLELLSAEQEARFAFIGAAAALGPREHGGLAVVDLGGGSCELVVGEPPDRVRWWDSVALGSSDMTERWLTGDPPPPQATTQAARHARELFATLQPPPARRLVAVGGGASSVATLAGGTVDLDGIDRILLAIRGLTAAQLAARHRIDIERARLLPASLVLLRAVCELFALPLEFGSGGLREGLLLDSGVHQ
jgi:exopolyphosphatase/guanosine-5'-triphosphate,3'-diphosphate pyrophosphatase